MHSFFKCSIVPDGYTKHQHDQYSKLRLQVLAGIFVCYSAYYLVRKNFVMVMPDLVAAGYSKTELGMALSALALCYGLSNFTMGYVADRVNVQKLMPTCLILSALISLTMGFLPLTQLPLYVLIMMLALNGFLQGAGWPCSAKLIAHWFVRQERGTAMSIWNLSHNIGCGILGPLAILAVILFSDWQCKLYLPAIIALFIAFYCYWLLKDSPEQAGLPAPSPELAIDPNREKASILRSFQLFGQHCLKLPPLWILAVVNACTYFIRYGIIDWAPLYLTEAKGFSFNESSWAFFAFEYAALPGTLLCGYLSDKHFKGKRSPVNALFMSLVLISLIAYWQAPPGNTTSSVLALIFTGFLIYGPVMLVHVHIIDLVPLTYAATAAGFIGLFGYIFGATSSNLVLGKVMDMYGWDACFQLLSSACMLALLLLLLLWLWENRHPNPTCEAAQTPGSPIRVPRIQEQQKA